MKITAKQAGARVHAGLGRPVQDSLEAAVVLEALGGLRSPTALALSPGAIDELADGGASGVRRARGGKVSQVSTREMIGLVATLLATTLWVAPLGAALGTSATARAWQIALPISIGLQWLLRRRGLNGQDGLSGLRGDRLVLRTAALCGAVVPVLLLLAPAPTLPAALIVTWVGGLLIVVRGWGVAYGICLVIATVMLHVGVPVVLNIVLVLLITDAAVLFGILTSPPSGVRPTTWRRSIPAAGIGFLLAVLIVTDPSVEWSSTRPFPVLALVPSLLGSIWANRHLNLIWTVLIGALASTRLVERSLRRNWRVFTAIIVGSFARLILGTLLVSALTFLLLRAGATSDGQLIRLLVGLAAFGVVGFIAALLESFSRLGSAFGVVLTSLVAAQVALHGPVTALHESALVVAALVGLLASVLPLVLLVRHPDRTLATLI